MRAPARAMALLTLAALVWGAWATGCTDLSSDCELNLNCPSTGEAPSCDGLYLSAKCDACLKETCCAAVGECDANVTCMKACVFGVSPSPPECNAGQTKGLLDAFGKCMTGPCAAQCVQDQCNAVTSNGCLTSEAGCDLVYPGMFVCLPFISPTPICGACDNLNGPYCGAGLRCHPGSGTCARYCCNDADCGTGRCELDPMLAFGTPLAVAADKVGVCVSTAPGGGAACDAPAVSPSGGACAGGFPPL
jgi:hypothetical protein